MITIYDGHAADYAAAFADAAAADGRYFFADAISLIYLLPLY